MLRVKWRDFTGRTESGRWTSFDAVAREDHLLRILAQPRGGMRPIRYDEASHLFMVYFFKETEKYSGNYQAVKALGDSFPEWISSQGYYIELDDTEYETDLQGAA